MYHHTLLWVNCTTYDLWCEQDTVNPLLQPDMMVLSHQEEHSHPYWYAQVIHIFHVMVQEWENLASLYSTPECIDMLFVCWFGWDVNYPSGWSNKWLHCFQFFDQESPLHAFGFLDPNLVVQSIHMIPAFGYGQTDKLLGLLQPHQMIDRDATDLDWNYYFANMWVHH